MTNPPSWNPIVAFTTCLKRYAKLNGRASRSEYWYWYLVTLGISLILQVLMGVCTSVDETFGLIISLLSILVCLGLLLPGIAVFVRRMHDTGRSGWSWLWGLIPFVGGIILLVFLVQPSAPANQYGAAPDGPEA